MWGQSNQWSEVINRVCALLWVVGELAADVARAASPQLPPRAWVRPGARCVLCPCAAKCPDAVGAHKGPFTCYGKHAWGRTSPAFQLQLWAGFQKVPGIPVQICSF